LIRHDPKSIPDKQGDLDEVWSIRMASMQSNIDFKWKILRKVSLSSLAAGLTIELVILFCSLSSGLGNGSGILLLAATAARNQEPP
jgi:hypothetical protein